MIYHKASGYFAASYLMEKSELHCLMDERDYDNLIVPPIEEEQFVALYDYDTNKPIVFATYAFPEQEHIEKYYKDLYFPREGFYGNGSAPMVIDFICVTGKRDIITGFRYIKQMFNNLGYSYMHWLRIEQGRSGYHKW
jgi:hemolysin-activating ACP:hemolysin acyltransferase